MSNQNTAHHATMYAPMTSMISIILSEQYLLACLQDLWNPASNTPLLGLGFNTKSGGWASPLILQSVNEHCLACFFITENPEVVSKSRARAIKNDKPSCLAILKFALFH